MAALTNSDRLDAAGKFVNAYFVGQAKVADLDSAEVKSLVDDLDNWLDANTAAANSAINVTVRTKASTTTKFAALAYVALKRGGLI